MANTFFISDTHFHHANMLKFTDYDGNKVRDFACVEDMTEYQVKQWNSVVRPQDHVYHLGDIVINKTGFDVLPRLNGHKRLIGGNHDIHHHEINKHFEKVYGVRAMYGGVLTHVPVHPDCLERWKVNVHGHLHTNTIRTVDNEPDMRYINISCEQLDHVPISLDELNVIVKGRGFDVTLKFK